MYVNEAMSTAVVTCRPDTSLDDIARKMWEADCGAVPVLDDAGKPVGIVTDRDIAMSAMLNHRPLWEIPAATVMQGQQLYCCSQGDTIDACLSVMEQHGVRRLPVTDDAGTLVGILSMGDALALTQPDNGRRKTPKVSVDYMFNMLRKVTAHHAAPAHPVQPV